MGKWLDAAREIEKRANRKTAVQDREAWDDEEEERLLAEFLAEQHKLGQMIERAEPAKTLTSTATYVRGNDRDQYHSKEYRQHLASPVWEAITRLAREWAGFRCQGCGISQYELGQSLDVHHKHYETLGRENLRDLEVLCRPCHDRTHAIKRTVSTWRKERWWDTY